MNVGSSGVLDIAFTSEPSPPRAGDNRFDVTVKGKGRGEGSIGMAGAWDVTITVTRGPQQLGSKKVQITAR